MPNENNNIENIDHQSRSQPYVFWNIDYESSPYRSYLESISHPPQIDSSSISNSIPDWRDYVNGTFDLNRSTIDMDFGYNNTHIWNCRDNEMVTYNQNKFVLNDVAYIVQNSDQILFKLLYKNSDSINSGVMINLNSNFSIREGSTELSRNDIIGYAADNSNQDIEDEQVMTLVSKSEMFRILDIEDEFTKSQDINMYIVWGNNKTIKKIKILFRTSDIKKANEIYNIIINSFDNNNYKILKKEKMEDMQSSKICHFGINTKQHIIDCDNSKTEVDINENNFYRSGILSFYESYMDIILEYGLLECGLYDNKENDYNKFKDLLI